MATLKIGPPAPERKHKTLARPPKEPPLFEQLFPCSWRGIVVPIAGLRVSFTQDLAEHKYLGIDAASIEATGRGSMQIEATIPFYNGIVPGKGESWGVLYPNVFREFLAAFVDRTTGSFNHPEIGGVLCKPHTIDFSHDPNRRDGVEVKATWIETTDPDDDTVSFSNAPSLTADVITDLDASTDDIRSLVPAMPVFEETIDDLLNKTAGAIDSVSRSTTALLNKPAAVLHRLKKVEDAALRAQNPRTWPFEEKCQKVRSAMLDLVHDPLPSKSRPTKKFKTPSLMTLCQIASVLGCPVDDLIQLNPSFASRPTVPTGTVIRFYS